MLVKVTAVVFQFFKSFVDSESLVLAIHPVVLPNTDNLLALLTQKLTDIDLDIVNILEISFWGGKKKTNSVQA